MKGQLRAHLVETGEIDNLKSLLKIRLMESGWRDRMKARCREIVSNKGVTTVDDLVKEITEEGRKEVSEDVKKELLTNISNALKSAKNKKPI